MKKFTFYALSLIATLWSAHPSQAMDCKQEDRYVYCQYSLYDMDDDRKKELLANFKQRLNLRLQQMNIPKSWDDAADKVLINDDTQLADIITETERRANEYTTDHMGKQNYKPVGWFIAIGGNMSANLPVIPVGGSATAMATFAYIPTIVTRFDKMNGQTVEYSKPDFDAGGLIQGGIGVGAAGGAGVRWGIGVIFGDAPHASDVIGAGFAEGISADADIPFPIPFLTKKIPNGLTLLTMKNSETHGRNFLLYATRDLGVDAKIEIHGSAFYLMSAEEFAHFLKLDKTTVSPVVTPIPYPYPIPSGSPRPPGTITTLPLPIPQTWGSPAPTGYETQPASDPVFPGRPPVYIPQ